ncbi:MAG: hypothetical protein R3242_07440 [Akkermansiaceae bacterium]|nr:hypothetical protein [Akkermansiaceae bacterium]
MSKSNSQVLILPGETGWEIWSRTGDADFELQHATDLLHPADLESIPAGELTMFFAMRSITTVPLRVMTTDEEMFEDLAALHAERLGLSADPLAGQLDDLFEVEREEGGAVLLSVWLKPPGEGDLPVVGPKAFDVSARSLPMEGNAVSVWRELNRWVFAVHQNGKLLYAQATADQAEKPDADLARELKLALMQLSLQGLNPKPEHIVVWTGDTALDLSALREAFELTVEIQSRPHPTIPQPPSKLLPEDVRAARQVAQRKQRVQLAIGGAVAFYVLLVGWLVYGLWLKGNEIEELSDRAAVAEPVADAYITHMERWNELENAIDVDRSPVDILDLVAEAIPPRSGVRLTTAEISAGDVKIDGEAPNLQAANQFSLNLERNPSLSRFDWNNREPEQFARGYKFTYRGTAKSELTP